MFRLCCVQSHSHTGAVKWMLLLMCCWRGVMQPCGGTSISDASLQLHRGEMRTNSSVVHQWASVMAPTKDTGLCVSLRSSQAFCIVYSINKIVFEVLVFRHVANTDLSIYRCILTIWLMCRNTDILLNCILSLFVLLQGIRAEPTDQLMVRKPKAPGRSSVKSTLYRAYAGKCCIFIILFIRT